MAQSASLLLFYRRPVSGSGTGFPDQPGVVVTGRLDAVGNYTDLATHTGFDFWHDIVPADTTTGRVLFYQNNSFRKTVGEVGVNGSYADVKNHLTDPPIAPLVVATRDGILIYYQGARVQGVEFGIAQTWKLASGGDFVLKSEPRILDFWTHIVPTLNGLVLFYHAGTGMAAAGRITPEGAYADLKGFTGFDPWTHIVPTSDGILLFYNRETGVAVTGSIDGLGNFADLRNVTLDPGWDIIAPTTNGLLLFYRFTASGAAAVVGRVDASSGAYSDKSLVNGLERWDRIVCVRDLPDPFTR